MTKFIGLLALLVVAWLLLRRFARQQLRRALGQPEPAPESERRGPRVATLVALGLLVFYVGYTIWHLTNAA